MSIFTGEHPEETTKKAKMMIAKGQSGLHKVHVGLMFLDHKQFSEEMFDELLPLVNELADLRDKFSAYTKKYRV